MITERDALWLVAPLILFGAFGGFLVASAWYGRTVQEMKRYIAGLLEDRKGRDEYIRDILGRTPDLPYCEDDDL